MILSISGAAMSVLSRSKSKPAAVATLSTASLSMAPLNAIMRLWNASYLPCLRAAIAARKQGKYDAFHSRMMAFKGTIDSDAVLKVATAAGLDLDRLKTDMAAPEIDKIIKRNYALAEALAIDGTPGLIVGDDLAVGAVDLDTLRKMIAAARKKGG